MRPRLALAAAIVVLFAPALAVSGLARPAGAAVGVTVTTLHFKVATGPDNRFCDVVGDLYVPADVTADSPGPAILTTNGFGGSKNDQKYIADAFSQRGYVVLSYSGLGFGGSGCPISDDNPAYDGKAASQLVSFLGGASGIAYTSFSPATGWTGPVPALSVVTRDAVAHDGTQPANDPRVGMIGGSYGGQIQFAAASVDPRIDTIIPLITWNDLVYSLTPGNGGVTPENLQPGLPGVQKRQWDDFFFGLGATAVVQQQGGNPLVPPYPEDAGCPGFQPPTCQAQDSSLSGFFNPAAATYLHGSSVSSYLDKIRIPTLLGQGEADSLFDLQEATATYLQLKARGVPAKMMWQSWGHSRIGPAKGENVNPLNGDTTPLLATYQGAIFSDWFDHYLKNPAVPAPLLSFDFFRPWAYSGPAGGAASVAAAYGHSPDYPAGPLSRLLLSGTDALVGTGDPVKAGAASLTAPVGAATSYSETSVIALLTSYGDPDLQPPPSDLPGTAALWTSPVLAGDVDVAGIPTLDVTVSAPGVAAQQGADPASHLVLFVKLYDLAPDGSVTLPERLISPVRVADVTKPLHVALPGIVHRFAAGHRLRLVVAASDSAYGGNSAPYAVSFPTSSTAPGVLSLPLVSAPLASALLPAASQAPSATAATAAPAAQSAPRPVGALAATGPPPLVPVAALLTLLTALGLRRRVRPRRD